MTDTSKAMRPELENFGGIMEARLAAHDVERRDPPRRA
jgi:hypothetical protein